MIVFDIRVFYMIIDGKFADLPDRSQEQKQLRAIKSLGSKRTAWLATRTGQRLIENTLRRLGRKLESMQYFTCKLTLFFSVCALRKESCMKYNYKF